jgi:acetoin utilization protein AcuB
MPILSLTDSGDKALRLMNEYRVFHLPLIQRDNYLALISEDDLLDWDTPEEPLSFAEFLNFRPFVFENSHPFEAIKVAKEFNLSVLPVLNAQNHFSGTITIEGLFTFMADQNAIIEPGGILVLDIEQRNYSLSEIARICESNDMSILNMHLKTIPETSRQWVSIKVNRTDVQSLIATFERFNYQVVEVFAADNNSEDLQSNYDALMHYINL